MVDEENDSSMAPGENGYNPFFHGAVEIGCGWLLLHCTAAAGLLRPTGGGVRGRDASSIVRLLGVGRTFLTKSLRKGRYRSSVVVLIDLWQFLLSRDFLGGDGPRPL